MKLSKIKNWRKKKDKWKIQAKELSPTRGRSWSQELRDWVRSSREALKPNKLQTADTLCGFPALCGDHAIQRSRLLSNESTQTLYWQLLSTKEVRVAHPCFHRGSSAFLLHFLKGKDRSPCSSSQAELPFLIPANQDSQSPEVKNSMLLQDKVVNDTVLWESLAGSSQPHPLPLPDREEAWRSWEGGQEKAAARLRAQKGFFPLSQG